MSSYTDKQRMDFLEKIAYKENRDGGWNGFYQIFLDAYSFGAWQKAHGGEYDYKTVREAVDAEMNKRSKS